MGRAENNMKLGGRHGLGRVWGSEWRAEICMKFLNSKCKILYILHACIHNHESAIVPTMLEMRKMVLKRNRGFVSFLQLGK